MRKAPYKITKASLQGFMKEKYPYKSVVGELQDAYLVQSSSGGGAVQQIQKNDVESFGILEGFVDSGIKKSPQQIMDDQIARNNLRNNQAERRFKDDATYQAALDNLGDKKAEYMEILETMSPAQAAKHKTKLRDDYASRTHAKHEYETSVLGHTERAKAVEDAQLKPYRGVTPEGYKSDSPLNKK